MGLDCTMYVVKTKGAVTAHLNCAFVFEYAKTDFLMTRLNYRSSQDKTCFVYMCTT